MNTLFFRPALVALILAITPFTARAAPNENETCKKMLSEGRGGGLSQKQCLCTYRVADQVLDSDIKTLLFDAWYTGENNVRALERLPNQKRISKQMNAMKRAVKSNCGIG